MGRQGARVARRKHKTGRVGFSHRVKREETMVHFTLFSLTAPSRTDETLLVTVIRPGSRPASMVSSSVARIKRPFRFLFFLSRELTKK